MADKLRTAQNLEALHARHVGTGHPDITGHEWRNNIVRDTYASVIGHPPLLSYMATGMNVPREKLRAQLLEKMVRGAGSPPAADASLPDDANNSTGRT
ncbi:splicing factor 3B subunit 10 (SF3b10) [Penicillium capsulatum]|uniref:Splicing factor 3B subunit 10 (SF3b10) n=1 Tax=Penicillium capsulatum TaxID=69766 RepID=A0A9W9LZL0_9EURO|nr:splicing factor 3B subunit 10 (SF3b10) [Penicillium capsulatum]KAJ6129836.1 splicing factor 3B subunit 10 (SF3b10) [Penicillium capsulatum]